MSVEGHLSRPWAALSRGYVEAADVHGTFGGPSANVNGSRSYVKGERGERACRKPHLGSGRGDGPPPEGAAGLGDGQRARDLVGDRPEGDADRTAGGKV